MKLLILLSVVTVTFTILIRYDRIKRFTNNPFSCPNCGERFYIAWYKLLPYKDMQVTLTNQTNLRCPNCKTVDTCTWHEDD